MLCSPKFPKMNGDIETDANVPFCHLSSDTSRKIDTEDDYSGLDSKSVFRNSSKSNDSNAFSFGNSFFPNSSKSNGRGDVTCGSQKNISEGSCQSLAKTSSPATTSSLPSFRNSIENAYDNATDTDATNVCTLSDPEKDPVRTQMLKHEHFNDMSGAVKQSRNSQVSLLYTDTSSNDIHWSQSVPKTCGSDVLNLSTSTNPNNQISCQSSLCDLVPDIDTSYHFSTSRSQLPIEVDNANCITNSLDSNCLSLDATENSNIFWNSSSQNLADDLNGMQTGTHLNNYSPLLSSLLYQQATGTTVNGSSQNLQTSNTVAAAAAAKRAITGGHQNPRQTMPSRSPVWNQCVSSNLEQNHPLGNSDPSGIGTAQLKPSNWMNNFVSHIGSSYPWNPSSAINQTSSKSNFNDVTSPSLSFGGNSSLRFGFNSLNPPPTPGISSNGQVKNMNSSGLATLYNMFPKRPQHRMMAHWQQQQQHQHVLQNQLHLSLSSPTHKVPITDFFSTQNSRNSYQDSMQLAAHCGSSTSSIQKMPHSAFSSINQNPANLQNNLNLSGNVDNLGSDKISPLDTFKYGMEQQLLEVMKTYDNSGNIGSNMLDDISLSNLVSGEAYPNSLMNNIPNFHQPVCRPGANSLSLIGNSNPTAHGLGNSYSFLSGISSHEEGFSRKVFVGGLPPDIDEEEITTAFRRFGPLVVDWPHKTESKAYFPPKGYCFLLFQEEQSVQHLITACIMDEDKYYWCVSSPTMKDKPVQIRPWNLADSDFVMDGSQPLDPRKTIFVGGVPRPLRAIELAIIMDRLYGGVCYAGIDIDPELKYPKGAGRVAFSNQQSYIAAISARFVQLQHNDIDKRVEVKPYVLDNQMCDECQGTRCGGKFAPFFCANVTCLQYYCEQCWVQIHSLHGREYHKPLVKEGAERPRPALYRW